jgi:hypothetical protein
MSRLAKKSGYHCLYPLTAETSGMCPGGRKMASSVHQSLSAKSAARKAAFPVSEGLSKSRRDVGMYLFFNVTT